MTKKSTVKRPRERVVPFLRGNVWWARVPRIGAEPIQRSLGVSGETNRSRALEICDFLRWLRSRQDAWLLDQMALAKVKVPPVYRAYLDGRLPEYTVELRDGIKDVDLEPMLAQWQKELERQKRPSAASRVKYLKQVRSLMPEGKPFRRSQFTRQVIRAWLGGLKVGQTNRYRAALSSFAKFLVMEDVLASNPVVQVPMSAEARPRTLHLTQPEAKRLLKVLPDPYKALHALMLATGMEWAAAMAVRPEDIGDRQVYAQGTKRAHRRRTVGVYDRWLWAWDLFLESRPAANDGERIFGAVNRWTGHDAFKRALKDAELPKEYTTHDHRHTWAVQAIRDRLPLPMIASNLGHRDSSMLLKVYGQFAPTGADFARITSISATVIPPTTGPE